MSHILFISPYSPPENGATSACIGETCTRLVKLGHLMTVLTTVLNYPTGIVELEYRRCLLQEEMRDSVGVVRVQRSRSRKSIHTAPASSLHEIA